MTIVNIRGTSGSGKTYLVREVMRAALSVSGPSRTIDVAHPDKHNKFLLTGYEFPGANLSVIGNYLADCGGCDKFSWKGAADWVMSAVMAEAINGRNVLFEGLMVSSWSLPRFQALEKVAPVKVIVLSTPLEECLEAIRQRRLSKGNTAELNPESTTGKYKSILSMGYKHRAAGLDVEFLSRGEALVRVCELLGLPLEST